MVRITQQENKKDVDLLHSKPALIQESVRISSWPNYRSLQTIDTENVKKESVRAWRQDGHREKVVWTKSLLYFRSEFLFEVADHRQTLSRVGFVRYQILPWWFVFMLALDKILERKIGGQCLSENPDKSGISRGPNNIQVPMKNEDQWLTKLSTFEIDLLGSQSNEIHSRWMWLIFEGRLIPWSELILGKSG